ncbi:MAG: hypothetical protein AAGN82_04765 [Myxococcota bacterium]
MQGRVTYRLAMATLGLAVGSCLYDFGSYDPRGREAPATTVGPDPCPSVGDEEACYDGPPATEGTGRCRAGIRRCTDAGWSACSDQTQPEAEDCINGEDDDCDGAVDDDDSECACEPGVAADCYGGPDGTLGVGICRRGRRDCATPDAVCTGEVTPVLEACGNERDDDCDGSVDEGCATHSACFPTSPAGEFPRDVASRDDDVVVTGMYFGAFAPGSAVPLNHFGLGDIFVAGYAPDTTHRWSRGFGGTETDSAYGVDIAFNRDVLVAGSYRSSWAFAGTTLPSASSERMAVFILNDTGSPLRVLQPSSADPGPSRALAVHAAGDFDETYVVGDFQGGLNLGPTSHLNGAGTDGFVARFDRGSLTYAWSRTVRGNDDYSIGTVISADDGDPIVAGTTTGPATAFGEALYVNAGSAQKGFIARLEEKAGDPEYITTLDASDLVKINGLANLGDDVIAAGHYSGTLSVNEGEATFAPTNTSDPFVLRIEADTGTVVWHRTVTDLPGYETGAQRGFAVAVSDTGSEIYVAVSVRGTLDIDGHAVIASSPADAPSDDPVLWRLDPDGNTTGVLRFGDASDQDLQALAALSGGGVFAAFNARGLIEFGAGPHRLEVQDNSDLCIARFPSL